VDAGNRKGNRKGKEEKIRGKRLPPSSGREQELVSRWHTTPTHAIVIILLFLRWVAYASPERQALARQWLGKVPPFNKGCQELKRKKEKRLSRFLFLFSYWLNSLRSFRGLLCTGSIPFAERITVFIFWTFRFLESELHRKKSAFKKWTFRNSKFSFS